MSTCQMSGGQASCGFEVSGTWPRTNLKVVCCSDVLVCSDVTGSSVKLTSRSQLCCIRYRVVGGFSVADVNG